MNRSYNVTGTVLVLMMLCFNTSAISAEDKTAVPAEEERKSAWLLTPLVSSSPRFGTSIGAMAVTCCLAGLQAAFKSEVNSICPDYTHQHYY